MLESLSKDILSTGYIHRPLPLHEEDSLEYRNKSKEAICSKNVCNSSGDGWQHSGQGEMVYNYEKTNSGNVSIRLTSPTIMATWPPGAPEDGDYSNFGTVCSTYAVPSENWESYNRIRFYVYPNCEGARAVHLTFAIKNDGNNKIPDMYGREGFHVINLKNNEVNECILEIDDIPRDKITEISFYFFINGKDTSTGEFLEYTIEDIELQYVNNPEVTKGWMPSNNQIVYSSSGYTSTMPKTAIASELGADEFKLIDTEKGDIKYKGKVEEIETPLGKFKLLNFSDFCVSGKYKIVAGNICTDPFEISENIWESSVWKTINFLFCERCGYPVPNKHGNCHRDILATHNGKSIVFNGGWHDAGDVSQQLIQTAEVTYSLFELASKIKDKNEMLYLRLLEEAQWGLDFILKSRFEDGYRATSVGVTIWSKGYIGDMDDMKARVHNQAYENFMCSGIEAFISSNLYDDKMLAHKVLTCAEEDFKFAMDRFEEVGFGERPIPWEHTYMTSESLFMATVSWAASMLYKSTGDRKYAEIATRFISYVLECQCTEPIGEVHKLSGFFYRDKTKKIIQHFNHQAREHVYLQALTLLCETQQMHEAFPDWERAISLYGNYLKSLIKFVNPYGMFPGGVYSINEAADSESFFVQHLLVDETASKNYVEQVTNGIKLDEDHYLRRFPVWFSFRGNNAVILSMGKAAALCGRFLKDEVLMYAAEQQLQWIVGKNPFAQSLMYGEGVRYAQQYAVLPGEMVGEIPVGVQTKDNEDLPYWSQMNNATYKEVWVGNAGKWLSIIADI